MQLRKASPKEHRLILSGELYSTEHSQRFAGNNAEVRFDRETGKSSAFRLLINGVSLTQCFRQRHREFLEAIGIKPKQRLEVGRSKGFGL